MSWDDFETTEDTARSGGNFLEEEGTYHVIVNEAELDPVFGNKSIDGLQLNVTVVEGTSRNPDNTFAEQDKTTRLMFFAPKLTQPKQGEFNRKRISRLLVVTSQVQEGGGKVKIDPAQFAGRQFICRLQKDDSGKYLEVAFFDFWHVDDPEAAKYPKSKEALELIPSAHRRSAQSFEKNDRPAAATTSEKPAQTVSNDVLANL